MLRRASRLIAGGKLEAAAAELAVVLEPFDPVTAPASPDLIATATVFACAANHVPEAQLAWALYADRASQRAFGPHHDLSIDAAETLAQVLQVQDLSVDAIVVLDRLIDAYASRGDVYNASGARRNLAELLHSDGRCDESNRQITVAFAQWTAHRRTRDLLRRGALIVMTHAAILAGCGRHREALRMLRNTQPVLDAVDHGWRIGNGLRAFVEVTKAITEHPSICTRPPEPASVSADPASALLGAYRHLLYEVANTSDDNALPEGSSPQQVERRTS